MIQKPLKILLIEDNPDDVRLAAPLFGEDFLARMKSNLSDCWLRPWNAWMKSASIDVILVDLGLPDSQGLETFSRSINRRPRSPS